MTQEQAKQLLRYEPGSGKLFWRKRACSTMRPDLLAGSIDTRYNYLRLNIKGKVYMAHRVIMVLMGHDLKETEYVDHINHNRLDNRYINLRIATRAQNNKNLSLRENNPLGVAGVYQHKASKRFIAYIHTDGKKLHLGCFKTLEEAAAARLEAEKLYGFHENHGK